MSDTDEFEETENEGAEKDPHIDNELHDEINSGQNQDATKNIKVSFGGIFFTREIPDTVSNDHYTTPELFMTHQSTTNILSPFIHYIGHPSNTAITETRRSRVTKQWIPNNARVRILYETCNRDTIWQELQDKVALKRKTSRTSFTLFSVFGNIIYCPYEREIECTAIRNLSHVPVISKITRDEKQNGNPSKILLLRYALSGQIGHNIQTRSNCMLEVMLSRIFRNVIEIVPRTEEDSSTVYFRIPSMSHFNDTIENMEHIHALIPVLGGISVPQSSIVEHMEHCTAYIQVTYLGTMFVRYVWDKGHPMITEPDIENTKHFFMQTTMRLSSIVNAIS